MTRVLLIFLCVLGGVCLPVAIGHEGEFGAPPKSQLLLDALATSQKKRARASFRLSLTSLSDSPPRRFSASNALDCEATPWSLTSSSGEVLSISSESEDRAIFLLSLWLCESYPVKRINESRGHLDPDVREIIVDGGGFAYRLGELDGSHLVVDLELEHLAAIQYKPSKKSEGYRLVATRSDEKEGVVRLSMSEAGKLVWTAKVEPEE